MNPKNFNWHSTHSYCTVNQTSIEQIDLIPEIFHDSRLYRLPLLILLYFPPLLSLSLFPSHNSSETSSSEHVRVAVASGFVA